MVMLRFPWLSLVGIVATASVAFASAPEPTLRTSLDGAPAAAPRVWRQSLTTASSSQSSERRILASLDDGRRAVVGGGGIARPIRVTLDGPRAVAAFPVLNAGPALARSDGAPGLEAPAGARFVRVTLDGSRAPEPRRLRLSLADGGAGAANFRASRHLRTVLE